MRPGSGPVRVPTFALRPRRIIENFNVESRLPFSTSQSARRNSASSTSCPPSSAMLVLGRGEGSRKPMRSPSDVAAIGRARTRRLAIEPPPRRSHHRRCSLHGPPLRRCAFVPDACSSPLEHRARPSVLGREFMSTRPRSEANPWRGATARTAASRGSCDTSPTWTSCPDPARDAG